MLFRHVFFRHDTYWYIYNTVSVFLYNKVTGVSFTFTMVNCDITSHSQWYIHNGKL